MNIYAPTFAAIGWQDGARSEHDTMKGAYNRARHYARIMRRYGLRGAPTVSTITRIADNKTWYVSA